MGSIPVGDSEFFSVPRLCHFDYFNFICLVYVAKYIFALLGILVLGKIFFGLDLLVLVFNYTLPAFAHFQFVSSEVFLIRFVNHIWHKKDKII